METVAGADGRVTARIYQEPAFRKTGEKWAPVDARVRPLNDPDTPVGAPDALHPLEFGVTGADLLDIGLGEGSVGFQWPDGNIRRPTVEGDDTVVYRDVAASTDLRLRSFTGGVRTELWLNSAAAPTSFRFHLSDPDGLLGEMTRQPDGSFQSEKLVDDENHLVVEPAYAYTPAVEGGPGPTAIPGAQVSVTRAGDGWDVTKSIAAASLGDRFPVVLDPTLSYGTYDDGQGTPGLDDCYIASDAYVANSYCGYDYVKAGYAGYGTTTSYKLRTLLRFSDIGALPANAYISTARVGLHQYGAKAAETIPYDVYEVTQDWQEPNWTQRYDNVGPNWTTAGGTVASGIKATTPSIHATATVPAYANYTWFSGSGLTSMVRRWRTTGLDARHGVSIRGKENVNDYKTFMSSRGATTSTGTPILEITYTIPAAAVTATAGDGMVKVTWEPQTTAVAKHVVNVVREATGASAGTGDVVCPQRPTNVAAALCPRHALVEGLVNGQAYQATVTTHFTNGTTGTTTSNVVVPSAAAGMTGLEPWWSYDEVEAPDPNSTLGVNVASGNVVLQQLDGTPMQGHGRVGYVLRRTYNSHFAGDDTLPGSMGAGWMMNLGEADSDAAGTLAMALDVPLNTPFTSADSPVHLLDRDGTRHRFAANSNTTRQVLVTTIGGGPFVDAAYGLGALIPQRLRAGMDQLTGSYNSVCIDRTYSAPPGVELALWRYIAVQRSVGSPCTPVTGTSAALVGYATMRPDRVRSEYSFDGRLLSIVDGTGTELRYLYQGGIPRTGVVLGNLEAVYEPRSCSVAGTGVAGAEVTVASALPTGCRAFRFAYDVAGMLTEATDAAGRITTYANAKSTDVPKPHLTTKTDAAGTVTYENRGVNGPGTYCAAGYLCAVKDARGLTTSMRHQIYSTLPGIHALSSVVPRGLIARVYTRSTTAVVAAGGAQREYSSIDARGRVGLVRDNEPTGTVFRETVYTWDADVTGGVRCTQPGNAFDNNVCKVVRKPLGTSPPPSQTTDFTYNVEGALLSRSQSDGVAVNTTTHGHKSQYVGLENTAQVWDDRIDGNRAVTSGSTARTAPNSQPAVYIISDATASLSPRGNSEPAVPGTASPCDTRDDCRAYLTRYVVDDLPTVSPNVVRSGGYCGTSAAPGVRGANSGLVCEITGPSYNNKTDGTALHSRTLFRYDQFGQRELMVTPEAVRRDATSQRYQYHYYGDEDRDLSGFVSAGGWLRGVTDPDGKFVAFGYDRAGNAIRTWDRRATSRTTPATTVEDYPGTIAAPTTSDYTQVLFGPGDADSAAAQPWRYPRSHRDALDNVTTLCHDADGNPTVTRAPRGTAGSYTPPCPATAGTPGAYDTLYDTLAWDGTSRVGTDGKLVHTATPGGQHTSVVRPSGHNGTGTHVGSRVTYLNELPIGAADEHGNIRMFEYDQADRLTQVSWTRAAGSVTSIADCAPGTVTTTSSGTVQLPAGRIRCEAFTSYDGLDNVTSETDAAGARVNHTYDAAGRRTVTVKPRSATVRLRHQWVYDADGNAVRYCPPRQFGTGDELTESSAAQTTNCPAGAVFGTHVSYDPAGRVATRTRYRQQADAGSDRAAATDTLMETMTYDADGNELTYGDPRANTGTTTTRPTESAYDLQGRLTERRVPFATAAGSDYVSTYAYDPAGTLRAETKPGSTTTSPRITAYTYDALNRVRDTVEAATSTSAATTVSDVDEGTGIRTRKLYDPDGNLVGYYRPEAFRSTGSTAAPDLEHLIRMDVDADGNTTAVYSPRSSSTQPLVNEYNVDCRSGGEFDASTVTVSDTMDAVPTYDRMAKPIHVCRTRYVYDARGKLVRHLPASEEQHESSPTLSRHRIEYRYSDDGLLAEVERPHANERDPRVGELDVPRLARDVVSIRYDGAGRQRSVTQGGRTWRWSHAFDATTMATSDPTSIDTRTHETTYGYNLAGEMTAATNPEGEVAKVRHYADGLIHEQIDGLANITRYAYDRNGNPLRTYSPSAVQSIDNPTAKDPTNLSGSPTSNFFDLANQLTTTLVPTKQDGTQVRRTDYTYDTAGRRSDTTTSLAQCPLVNGRCQPSGTSGLTAVAGQTSGTQTLTYYPTDRVRERRGRGSPRPTIAYEYDLAGNVTTVADSTNVAAVVEASYFLDGLVREVTGGTRSTDYRTDYTYSGDGLIQSRRQSPNGTTSDHTMDYAYNSRRLLTVWDELDEGSFTPAYTEITYDIQGRPALVSNQTADLTFSYDNDDTLISKTVTSERDDTPGPQLAKWTYAYDKAQRITEQQLEVQHMARTQPGTGGAGTHGSVDDRTYGYTYDDAGRLDTFTQGATPTQVDHDRNGNRTRYGSATTDYNPDDTIHATSGSAATHTYAPFGGHLADSCTANTYDAFDRLASVDVSGNGCGATISSTYSYDGLDRQRSENGSVNDGVSTRSLGADLHYDGLSESLAVETHGPNEWTRYMLDPSGAPSGTASAPSPGSTSPRYSAQVDDGTGNLGLSIDLGGFVADDGSKHVYGCTARFDPYGDPVGRSADGTNVCNTGDTESSRLYRGARRDPLTGAYQFGSRTYVPGRAGFLTPDGYAAEGTGSNLGLGIDPLTRNSYAYVNGDPINLYDPTGHGPKEWAKRAWGFITGAGQQVAGVGRGIVEAAYETGKGAVRLAWTGAALTNLRGNDARVETWNETKAIYQAVTADPWAAGEAVVGSFAEGARSDWKNGNYGEAVGRGLFAVVSSIATGGAVAKVNAVNLRGVTGGLRHTANRVSALGTTVAGSRSRAASALASRASANPKTSAYSVAFEMSLDRADFGQSRDLHFRRANKSLDEALTSDPAFAARMEEVIAGVQQSVSKSGGRKTPAKWRWHHAPSESVGGRQGVMQLVPTVMHTPGSAWWRLLHPNGFGGYSEWAIPNGAPPNRR